MRKLINGKVDWWESQKMRNLIRHYERTNGQTSLTRELLCDWKERKRFGDFIISSLYTFSSNFRKLLHYSQMLRHENRKLSLWIGNCSKGTFRLRSLYKNCTSSCGCHGLTLGLMGLISYFLFFLYQIYLHLWIFAGGWTPEFFKCFRIAIHRIHLQCYAELNI